MCTLTLAWQVFEGSPVIVAANRDEYLDRPAEPPAVRDWESKVVAPKDAEADGTWIGYNEHGVVVAITNRWMDADIEGERSRGLLVRDALAEESAEAASRDVERELDARTYDGFNLLLADATTALLVEYDGHRAVRTLEPGVHVIVNVGADGEYDVPEAREEVGSQQAENANSVVAALEPEPGETGDQWLDRATSVIGDHEYGVCVHADRFGTRSSSLIRFGAETVQYQFADGPPCETPFEQVEGSIPVDH